MNQPTLSDDFEKFWDDYPIPDKITYFDALNLAISAWEAAQKSLRNETETCHTTIHTTEKLSQHTSSQ